jgi:hypothetical protein
MRHRGVNGALARVMIENPALPTCAILVPQGSFSRIAPAHAGPTRLPRQPTHAPDGERCGEAVQSNAGYGKLSGGPCLPTPLKRRKAQLKPAIRLPARARRLGWKLIRVECVERLVAQPHSGAPWNRHTRLPSLPGAGGAPCAPYPNRSMTRNTRVCLFSATNTLRTASQSVRRSQPSTGIPPVDLSHAQNRGVS